MTNTILTATGIDKRFSALVVLKNVDFAVGTNEIIGNVEPNGAGKTTLMNALSGTYAADAGKSTMLRTIACAHNACAGKLTLNGNEISQKSSFERVTLGLAIVPEGCRLFQDMSVEENLHLGNVVKRAGTWTVDKIFEAFPNLLKRRHARAGNLSGGEQQAFWRRTASNSNRPRVSE